MDERPFDPEHARGPTGPSPTDCPTCGEPAGETIPVACPSCGTARLATLRFMDPQTFERARAVLHDRGLIVHDRHPNRGYQGMGALFLGTAQPSGVIWIPAERRDDAEAALDEAGLPVPTSGRPIVDRSEPVCPECGHNLDPDADPDQGGECPACGAGFDWVDIEAEALAAGPTGSNRGDDRADASGEAGSDRRGELPPDMPADPARRDDGPAALDPFAGGRDHRESADRSPPRRGTAETGVSNTAFSRIIGAARPALLIGGLVAGFVAYGQGSGVAWGTAAALLGLWALAMLVGPPVLDEVRPSDADGDQKK